MNNSRDNRDDTFEWGYAHEKSVTARGELVPITTDTNASGWYSSRATAEKAQWNDLRWRLPTFLIRRPRPAQPEIIGREVTRQDMVFEALREELGHKNV